MDAFLKRLIKEQGLTGISVHLIPENTCPFGVYLHWGDRECRGGNGKTVKEAVKVALKQMREERRDA